MRIHGGRGRSRAESVAIAERCWRPTSGVTSQAAGLPLPVAAIPKDPDVGAPVDPMELRPYRDRRKQRRVGSGELDAGLGLAAVVGGSFAATRSPAPSTPGIRLGPTRSSGDPPRT